MFCLVLLVRHTGSSSLLPRPLPQRCDQSIEPSPRERHGESLLLVCETKLQKTVTYGEIWKRAI